MLKIEKLKFNVSCYSSKNEKEVNAPPKTKNNQKNFFLFLDNRGVTVSSSMAVQ
jgi:hypothetical protein